jgi:predicted ATP-grasp superfamily ATP-dependent carboligase
MRVLVSQSGMKHTLGLMRHLSLAGHEVTGVGTGWRNRAGWSRYPAGFVAGNEKAEDRWLEDLTAYLRKAPTDVYVPMGFPVNEFAVRNHSAFAGLCGVAVPDEERFSLAKDKLRMAQLATELGVGTPSTHEVKSRAEAEALATGLTFPVVIKGRFETGGQRVLAVARTAEDFLPEFDRLCAEFALTDGDLPIIQEFVPGTGWGFFAFYQHGRCRRVFMHRRVRELPASGGSSTCAESVRDESLEKAGRLMLDHLHWHGAAMVEFRKDDRDGTFKLMEINPKFWGSLELALAAGADFGSDYVKAAAGEEVPEHGSNDYRSGLRYCWPFDGDLLHAMERPRHAVAVFADMFNPRTARNAWLRDPLPLLHSMAMCGKQIVCRMFGKPVP